ncbi:MAG: hypothetical protein Q4D77_01775 [Peptostreptococcaceae bacterium]|nr:hypothetical protein [Peptostreptococcaceae bacterium]
MKHWIREIAPKGQMQNKGKTDWFSNLDKCFRQGRKYCVLARQIKTQWGIVEHICIRNAESTDIPWAEKQRIKNELYGENRIAIEVYPSKDRLVDSVNMYHLWIMPEGFEMPFGIHENDKPCEHVDREA